MSNTERIKAGLRGRGKKPTTDGHPEELWLSTGSTTVNLAMTGRATRGLATGCYYLWVGDSRACKTFLALTALAEASVSPDFSGHRLVYNAPERGARMPIRRFFGEALHKRMERRHNATVEDFYYGLDDDLREGRPFVHVLDSESSLSSEDAEAKFQERKRAYRRGREAAGSYGDGKAKKHSEWLRRVVTGLERTGSILVVVSQSRDNVGFGAQFNPKTRAGGRALTFYATAELWFSVKGAIKREVRGKRRKVGSVVQVQVKKSRDTGYEPIVSLHHYPSVGVDDTGSVVDFLVEEGRWGEKGGKVDCRGDFGGFSGSREDVVAMVEEGGLDAELREAASEVWQEIEAGCSVRRRRRYE